MYNLKKTTVIMDIECYPNYFLVAFRDTLSKQIKHFEMRGEADKLNVDGIRKFLRNTTVVTFNGNNYDMPMVMYALTGASCSELHQASTAIIVENLRSWDFLRSYELSYPSYLNHVDIFEIPAGTLSLKAYSARLGCVKLQDLPIDPNEHLNPAQMDAIAAYCDNDTANTLTLFESVRKQLQLRIDISNKYGIDMRSKSDAQVGEAIFKYYIERDTGRKMYKPDFDRVNKRFAYTMPDFIYFDHSRLVELYNIIKNTVFYIKPSGHTALPEQLLDFKISIGKSAYTMGIGGLHSTESGQSVIAASDEFIMDADVGSYYPSIIINGGYYPEQCGKPFYNHYKRFRDDRLAWKHDPEKKTIVDTYKIALNGSYGKLSSKYSFLFSPKMLIHVTITGQLSLLMLIERLEKIGVSVISANTDGIVIHGKKDKLEAVKREIAIWEIDTEYTMEYTEYSQIHSQSVNSYLAQKTDGSWKRKGDYAPRGLATSGNGQVCIEAVIAYLDKGTPLRETIESCKDFLKFTNFQQVKGGGYKDGKYLGKVVRWYYSIETKTDIVNSNGNTVPLTRGAKPAMDLPDEFPTDIDYDWYVREAYSMLERLGVKNTVKERRAFGLSDKPIFRYACKEGQKTYHLIDMRTKESMCEASLKDRHDEWDYLPDSTPIIDVRVCSKCRKKENETNRNS